VFTDAFQGIGVSLSFAFIILLVMTANFYVSLLSILCITSIILTLLGATKALGWKFAMIESTCVIIFIGISVDYVVHLCHQYVHSVEPLRYGRTKAAYRQMGQTILAGALTSIFSASFLLLCEASSIQKFGLMLMITIVSSLLAALILLPSLFFVIGPNGRAGDLRQLCIKMKFK
jgi:predicted RND superfamily exporter protein